MLLLDVLCDCNTSPLLEIIKSEFLDELSITEYSKKNVSLWGSRLFNVRKDEFAMTTSVANLKLEVESKINSEGPISKYSLGMFDE